MIHWLKTEEIYFDDVWDFAKPYEVRDDRDRNFDVGDILILGEGIQNARAPRAVVARVKSIMTDAFPGIAKGYVGLGLLILGHFSEDDLTLFTHNTGHVSCVEWRHTAEARGVVEK